MTFDIIHQHNIPFQPRHFFRRALIFLALLMAGISGVEAQTANYTYIFYNANYGYLINNGGNPGVSTTFTKNAIWVANNTMGTTSRNVHSYTDDSKYFRGTAGSSNNNNGTFTLGNSESQWQIRNNYLNRANATRGYVRYNGNGFIVNSSTTAQNFTGLAITINAGTTSNPTLSISAADGLSNGGIQLSGSVSGTYIPTYYYASVRNYNNNNTQTYYWTSTTEATTTQPSITNWNDASITWEVTTGGAYASVSSDGLVTITANPTGNVVVRMNVSKGGYTGNTSITLTRTAVAENTATSYSDISITPASATLDLGGTQTFSVSNTVTEIAATTPAYSKLTVDGNDYYYYNNSLNTTTPTPTSTNTTLNLSNVSWTDGNGGGYYTLAPYYSDSSNEVTLTRSSNSTDTERNYIITATANYGGKTQNLTASAAVKIPINYVDLDGISCSDINVPFGETQTLVPNPWINGNGAMYVNIVYSVADPTVASVDENGVVTALKVGSTTVTLQTKKIDGTNGVSCTANITVSQASLPAPTISIANGGVATLTDNSGISGATIRYTTDGTDPTASTTTTVASGGTVTLTRGQTIMAIVTVDGGNYSPSPITTEIYVETGIFGDIVYLDDRENHKWSYYSDPECPIRSLNPADVKITYYGNGTNNISTTNGATPASNSWTQNATGVKVGPDDNCSTFAYYKTLERLDGSTSDNPTGLCEYTTIPNPFSVRPTYQYTTGDLNKYCGFYMWRIKEIKNGKIYDAATNGSQKTKWTSGNVTTANMLYAEGTYYFQPDNEYGMEVELEALWARAYVKTGNANTLDANNTLVTNLSGDSYERNFFIITSGNTDAAINRAQSPVTISCRYPDGTSGGSLNSQISQDFTANAATKFEYVVFNAANRTFTASGLDLIVGRGCSGTVNTVYGNNANSNINQTLRLESGTFTNLYPIGANGPANNLTKQHIILGSDYDRVKEDDAKLRITDYIKLLQSGNHSTGTDRVKIIVKSGTFQDNQGSGTAENSNNCFYLWSPTQNNTGTGTRTMIVEGGKLWHIAGGLDCGNGTNSNNLTIRVKGGTIRGSVFGGAARYDTKGYKTFIFTGGTVQGWIAGGSNGYLAAGTYGSGTEHGTVTGRSYVYVGGSTHVGGREDAINMSIGGYVFGAGCGNTNANTNAGSVTDQTNVVIADKAYVKHGVYGGGAYGSSLGTANVYVLGNAIIDGDDDDVQDVIGGVYGGARQKGGGTVNITMNGGTINKGGLFGGSNATGTISGNVTMQIDGGQVGTPSTPANIHGGGYGQPTIVSQNVDITLGASGQTTGGVTVYGDVYGGSALGSVNGTAATTTYHTNVTLNKGTINGSLYGGALGDNSTAANVYGPVTVTVNGGSVKKTDSNGANGSGAVYGCNNINGAPQRAVAVVINGTDPAPAADQYALFAVYGGGNKANYSYGTPTVTVNNCDNSIEYVYGGGNAAHITNGNTDVQIYGGNKIGNVFGGGNGTVTAANVSGNTRVRIYGGTIGKVFGGSNSAGSIGGTISVEVNKNSTCAMHIDEVYGGGNMAASNAGSITISCTGGQGEGIGDVYGGAREANITGDISLNITGGSVERVFGGNNISGTISGTIQVDVNWTEPSTCGYNYLGYVYGAGNQANYGGSPVVNIKKGTVSHDVFGGGLEAAVAGDVTVNVTGGSVEGALYGGGALANTNTNSGTTTAVNLNGGTVHDVYGGGLGQKSGFFGATSDIQAIVGGDVTVTLDGSVVTGNIFGCNNLNGTPKGHVKVWVKRTVGWTGHDQSAGKADDSIAKTDQVYEVAAVYGGGNMAAYEPTNASTEYTEVLIDGCDLTSIEYVYGGGNAASVPATYVTVNGTYEIGYLFGGGNGKDALPNGADNPGANVGYKADGTTSYGTGEAKVDAFGGTIHRVFGGSNTLGDVRSTSVAYLDEGSSCPLKVDEVYGGGNEAYMTGNLELKLGCITYMKELYGGAKNANVGGDIVLTITSGHFDRVFGGNNLGGTISGSITVNIEETGCKPVTIGELYGCGNQAAYSTPSGKTDPTVNIKSFTSIGRVFGGGLGASAIVTGNPTININEVVGANASATSAYAGTTVTLPDLTTVALPAHTANAIGVIGTVFGGGNAAPVTGNTNVNIGTASTVSYVSGADHSAKTVMGADIQGNVFGGGNQANVTGNTNVVVGK